MLFPRNFDPWTAFEVLFSLVYNFIILILVAFYCAMVNHILLPRNPDHQVVENAETQPVLPLKQSVMDDPSKKMVDTNKRDLDVTSVHDKENMTTTFPPTKKTGNEGLVLSNGHLQEPSTGSTAGGAVEASSVAAEVPSTVATTTTNTTNPTYKAQSDRYPPSPFRKLDTPIDEKNISDEELRATLQKEIKTLKYSIKFTRRKNLKKQRALGLPTTITNQDNTENTKGSTPESTIKQLGDIAEALYCEKGDLLDELEHLLDLEKEKLDAESEKLKAENNTKTLLGVNREGQKEALLMEKTQKLEEETEILKEETKTIQKQLRDDLLAFKQPTMSKDNYSLGETIESKEETVEKSAAEPELITVLETEMTRLVDEANAIWDDLETQQKESIEDLNKNYKLKRAWTTKSQKSVGLELKVRHCCSEKRAGLVTWVERSVVHCGVCNKGLPTTLVNSHLKYCSECDCHVCFRCNCETFHLAKQEELLIASEDAEKAKLLAKKTKKTNKNQRKKERQRKNAEEKKKTASNDQPVVPPPKKSKKSKKKSPPSNALAPIDEDSPTFCDEGRDDDYDEGREDQMNGEKRIGAQDLHDIDFVTYLQQTGSLIALSDLMNELEEGEGVNLDDGYEGLAAFHDPRKQSVLQEIKMLSSEELDLE
jgi:hypothetical protein